MTSTASRDSPPRAPQSYAISTLGCKVNAFESAHLAQQLRRQNARRAAPGESADVCIINTCSVTAEADRQARQLVRRAVRDNPNARVVVTGCYAQLASAACAAIPGVSLVVGNAAKLSIPQLLSRIDDVDVDVDTDVDAGDQVVADSDDGGIVNVDVDTDDDVALAKIIMTADDVAVSGVDGASASTSASESESASESANESTVVSANKNTSASPSLNVVLSAGTNASVSASASQSTVASANTVHPAVAIQTAAPSAIPTELLTGFDGRARAFVQVQQGCDRGCTFCIIHRARGPSQSFPAQLIRRQVAQFIDGGVGEIVLCGVDLGAYGDDFVGAHDDERGDASRLATLIRQLGELRGDYQLRLSSIDPAHLKDELLALFAEMPRLCPHLHLSMQSASTLILKRMKRRATREIIYDRVAALRAIAPRATLSADVLVGFPTESDADFAQTLRAIDELEIAHPHVFAYSPRVGTPAARIPKQIEPKVRKQRAKLARAAGQKVWRRVAARQLGTRARVLIEKIDEHGIATARAADYFSVQFRASRNASQTAASESNAKREANARGGVELQPGDWARVQIDAVDDAHGVLRARLCDSHLRGGCV